MKNVLTLLFLIILPSLLWAQKTVTISGYVLDEKSGENLPNASVQIPNENKAVNTNNYGFFSISIKPGKYNIKVSYIGYAELNKEIDATNNVKVKLEISPRQTLTKEIVIKAKRKDANIKTTEVGMHQLSVESIKKLPVIMGEVDILKSIQLLPGVKNGGEGSSGFYVRGGGPDQNLILLDDAVVYNTGHLFGFFSVFNGDAIKNVTLIKGGMPANYGGRLSSVLDVSMKEGNNKAYKVEGGIGLIASRLSIQGPIVKNKGSFILSGRRTYATELLKALKPNDERLKNFGYYFYDFNAKANYQITKNDRLYLSGYFGDDVFKFSNTENTFKARIPWGNRTATLRWNHIVSDKLFMNTSAVYNSYKFEFGGAQQGFSVKLNSGIKDWNLKTDFDYYTAKGHNLKFGAATTYHTFQPSTVSGTNDTTDLNPVNPVMKYALESSIYVLDDFDLNSWCRINAGLRYSSFLHLGPYSLYTKQNGVNIDSTTYGNNKIVTNYGGLEPRLNARFSLNKTTSIKTSITKSFQYIHLVTNNGSTLPTDLWVPSTKIVQPQMSWQYSAGLFKNVRDNMFETSIEVYYKNMNSQLEYRENYTPNNNNDPEYDFVQGKGWAYGTELFINKTKGRFTGWIGYTLSYSKRKFNNLNDGLEYFAKYDRRHDISIVTSYEINKKWNASAVFIFSSGNRITLPSSLININNTLLQQYSQLNNQQLPPYHRLDLGAVYTPIPRKPHRFKSSWTFGVYNAYNNFNPYIIYLDVTGTVSNGIDLKLKAIQIFPIIPSVTWNFKF
jgi:CarboxypepD_reg-like domain/TonB-dependent Receptor Plug Domain